MNTLIKTALLMTAMAANTLFAQKDNPLLKEWNTPYQTPPFAEIKTEHYMPAVKQAMKEAEKNIKAIASSKKKPTFENTIVALEKASALLDKVTSVMYNMNESNTNPELQKLLLEVSPKITTFSNSIFMNEKLFERVKAVYTGEEMAKLNGEQKMLVEKTYMNFLSTGATLDEDGKKKYKANAEELSKLSQRFKQNVLADNNNYFMHIKDKSELSGLPENVINSAADEAKKRNLEGWVFTLDYPSYGPFMQYADNRERRRELWEAYNSKGNRNNENNNNEIIRNISNLRLEQANILGYKTYADYVLSRRMAETKENVEVFLSDLLKSAMPVAKADVAKVQEYAKKQGADFELQRWDYSYYSEKLKEAEYSFSGEMLRPYFQLDKVRDGIFGLFGMLYGLEFKENADIQVYHPDVKVYEVSDGGRFMGVLYLDMYPRASKRGGAWKTSFRGQYKENGKDIRPLIQVVCNFSKPVGDTPALLSFDEVETFLHEMGHAIHGMLSDVTYESISGTATYRDFVELPSQIMENWATEPEFLKLFATHYQTNEPLPAEYIEKLKQSENFNSGYYCVRQLSLGLTDMAYHTITAPLAATAEEVERKAMAPTELMPEVDGTVTSTSFSHIFAGGYAVGYYGYKWAEVLDADAFSVFKKNGIFDKATAKKFRTEILSRGGTEHPAVMFKNFMGREPNNEALLIRSGFIKTIER
ncbi:MAG: M3 family metallopeptidase [Bacteroidales bacterium]|nr:M3 family metallopeptidase [Bacteroidales bacterium]